MRAVNKKVAIYVGLLVVGIIVGSAVAYGVQAPSSALLQRRAEALRAELTALQSEVQFKITRLTNLEKDLAAKEAALTAKQSEVDRIRAQITTREAEISTLRAEVDRLRSEKDSLTARIRSLEAEISSLKGGERVSTLEAEVRSLRAEVNKLQEQVESLKNENDALRAQIKALQARVAELQQRLEQATTWDVCFPRQTRCDSLLVSWIDRANRTLNIMIYSFTSDSIGDAVMRAHSRGVQVLVVMERQQVNVEGSEYTRLLAAGVNVRIDGNSALMHHKAALIDGKIVATGSYNWSASAETRNDENLIFLFSPTLAEKYAVEFWRVWNLAGYS